jgi:hypothetical protein
MSGLPPGFSTTIRTPIRPWQAGRVRGRCAGVSRPVADHPQCQNGFRKAVEEFLHGLCPWSGIQPVREHPPRMKTSGPRWWTWPKESCGAVVRTVLSSDLSLGGALPLSFGVQVVLFTPITQVKSSRHGRDKHRPINRRSEKNHRDQPSSNPTDPSAPR